MFRKKPLGAVLYKRCSKVWFCLRIWGFLYGTTSGEKKRCSVKNENLLANLGVLLKICRFAWYNEVFSILTEETNLEHPYKIRHKKRYFVRINLFTQNRSINVHNMETWQRRTSYYRASPSGSFFYFKVWCILLTLELVTVCSRWVLHMLVKRIFTGAFKTLS